MSKKKCYCFILLWHSLLISDVFPQSIGLVYEAASFNLNNLYHYHTESNDVLIKNIFINYNAPLSSNFTLSARAGYGWANYEGTYGFDELKSVNEEHIIGFPIETEIKYQHFIESSSVYEPFIGLGLGYYNYTTKHKIESNTKKYLTNGFAQFVTFGINIHISKSLVSSLQIKKNMVNNITTTLDEENSSTEMDFTQGSGLDNLSISIGICKNLNIIE